MWYAHDDFTKDEIWAFGVRNPWRFSFDRLTGDLYIADVGQNAVEEVNFQPANSNGGENYGWRCYEGDQYYNHAGCFEDSLYTFPVHVYNHLPVMSCSGSITGGYVYRGIKYPGLLGKYFFADFCSGEINCLSQETPGTWAETKLGVFSPFEYSSFGESAQGELFLASMNEGTIYEIRDKNTSGIGQVNEEPVKIYPNPTADYISFIWPEGGSRLQIELTDIQGRKMPGCRIEKIVNGTYRMWVDLLPPGIFLIAIRDGKQMGHGKFLKVN
jgi:hypothetical protein